jgi:hypothetical protein
VIARVFGWGSATWTALGTIALTVVTGAYVVVVGRGNRRLRESAEAAAKSAKATEDLVELQGATLPVEFSISSTQGRPLIMQNGGSSRVWVHGVTVTGASGLVPPEEPWHLNRHIECQPDGLMETSIPAELEPGDKAWFIWPFPGAQVVMFDARFRVEYSFGSGTRHSFKRLSVTFGHE